jgi:8-oxo-dGTP diphosphatase
VLAAIIYNDDKQILIAQRKQPKSYAGMWEFPGGKLEKEETPEQCIVREIKEELNIVIRVEHPYQNINYACPDGNNILLMAYLCTYLNGEIQLSDHSQIEWLHPSHLKKYKFTPADKPLVDSLIKDFR